MSDWTERVGMVLTCNGRKPKINTLYALRTKLIKRTCVRKTAVAVRPREKCLVLESAILLVFGLSAYVYTQLEVISDVRECTLIAINRIKIPNVGLRVRRVPCELYITYKYCKRFRRSRKIIIIIL